MVTRESILVEVAGDVLATFQANWIYLAVSIVLASAIQVYVGADRLAGWLRSRTPLAVIGAVALGALTPFCSCGTTAVVLGALASAVPWAPIVAFMVSSPLTSPGEFVLSVGLFGTAFATTYFVAALAIGMGAGWITHHVDRAGWLINQHRVHAPLPPRGRAAPQRTGAVASGESTQTAAILTLDAPSIEAVGCEPAAGCCGAKVEDRADRCNGGSAGARVPALCSTDSACERDACGAEPASAGSSGTTREFAAALWANGKRLAVLFFGFTALGYLLIRLIPTQVLVTLLGDDSPFAVPLAALLGIPVYVNSDGSLPLVASLMDGGMGSGAAMAFLITGAGTSIGAVSGMLLIARWRVVALVVGSLVVGATVTGYLTAAFT